MEAKERIKKAYEFLRSNGTVHTQQDVADVMGVKKENISRAFNGNEKYLHQILLHASIMLLEVFLMLIGLLKSMAKC